MAANKCHLQEITLKKGDWKKLIYLYKGCHGRAWPCLCIALPCLDVDSNSFSKLNSQHLKSWCWHQKKLFWVEINYSFFLLCYLFWRWHLSASVNLASRTIILQQHHGIQWVVILNRVRRFNVYIRESL